MELIEMALLWAAKETDRKTEIVQRAKDLMVKLGQKNTAEVPTERELLLVVDRLVARAYIRKNGLVKYEITNYGNDSLYAASRVLSGMVNAIHFGAAL